MRVLTRDRRFVAVAGPSDAGAGTPALRAQAPPYTSGGPISLLRDAAGRKKSQRYAVVARANPWVMASINARAGLASRVPMHVFRPITDDDAPPGARERVRRTSNGPGVNLVNLMAAPDDRLSWRRWARRMIGDVLTHGNALAEQVMSGSTIVALRWQPWVDVHPKLSDDGLRINTFYVPTERDFHSLGLRRATDYRQVDRTEALHLTIGDDTETPLGTSPLASLHATHALHDAAWRFATSYLEEGMFPSGVVEIPERATLEQAKLTRELIRQLHTGSPDKAGTPGVLGFGRWKQISATPDGAKLVELAKASREEVAAAFRAPLTVLGDLSAVNKATSEVARTQFVVDVVGEDVNILESEFQAQIVDPRRRWHAAGIWVEGELASQLRADPIELSKMINREVGAPIATVNEGRRWMNLPPSDDPNADKLILNPGTPGAADGESDAGDDDDE